MDALGVSGGVSRIQLLDSALEESVGDEFDSKTVVSVVVSFGW